LSLTKEIVVADQAFFEFLSEPKKGIVLPSGKGALYEVESEEISGECGNGVTWEESRNMLRNSKL